MARRGSDLPPLPKPAELLPIMIEFIGEYGPTDRQLQIIVADRFGYAVDEIDVPLVRGSNQRFLSCYSMAISYLANMGLLVRRSQQPIILTERGRAYFDGREILDPDTIDLRLREKRRRLEPDLGESSPVDPADEPLPLAEDSSRNVRQLPDTPERRAERAASAAIERMPSMKLSQLHALWVNANRIAAQDDDLSTKSIALRVLQAIAHERDRRGSKKGTIDPDEKFVWPSTEIGQGASWTARGRGSSEGLLAGAGYHVGVTRGQPQSLRRRVLSEAYGGMDASRNDPFEEAEWGPPSTGRRLKRLAYAIAAMTKSAKARTGSALAVAISEWEEDLEWLRVTYYDGRYDFPWPSTD